MNKKNILLILFSLCFLYIVYIFEPFIKKYSSIIFLFVITIIIGIIIYKKNNKELDNKKICFFILLFGIITRLFYIINYLYIDIQHDLGKIGEGGHLDYIYTIYKTGHLPVTNLNEFYHPPLFHLLGAFVLKITSIFSFSNTRHFESLQYFTFIISVITLIYLYKLINKIKIKDKYKILFLILICFFPLSIILSGSINNDSLLLMNIIISIYYLFEWYECSNLKNTIILAIFVGLCVFTKLNGVLIAIPVLYIFIRKMIESKKIKEYIKLFLVFGLISLPIGLWYPIRNYILFNQKLFYVLTDNLETVYVGNYSIIQRFLSFSFDQYIHIYAYPHGYDYNILAYLIKTSLFDELIGSGNIIQVFAFFIHTILIILFGYYVIKYLISKNKNVYMDTMFVSTIFIFISYIIFNISYPYACSMHFRYIFITFFYFTMIGLYQMSLSKNKSIYKVTRNLIIIFSLLSVIMIYMKFH